MRMVSPSAKCAVRDGIAAQAFFRHGVAAKGLMAQPFVPKKHGAIGESELSTSRSSTYFDSGWL